MQICQASEPIEELNPGKDALGLPLEPECEGIASVSGGQTWYV